MEIKVNGNESNQIMFSARIACLQVRINNDPKTEAKYLGIYSDKKITWKTHIRGKKRQISVLKLNKVNWLIGRKSQLSVEKKLLLFRTIMALR